MEKVALKPLLHREKECIGIYFEHHAKINGLLRQQAGAKWSHTKKCWYIPLNKEAHKKLSLALKGLAVIEQAALYDYLAKKKKQPQLLKAPVKQVSIARPAAISISKRVTEKPVVYQTKKISDANAHVLPLMEQHLKLKAYSPSTRRTYLNEMHVFLQALGNICADDLTQEHIKRYLVYCYEKLGLKENTLHSRMNALKFYFEQVLNRDKFFWEIPRPKKQLLLPKVFNQHEITAIIKSAGNMKHKAMLMLCYAAGLRVSEVVKIKVTDVDSLRMCIIIRQAKGKKDRVVGLSPVLLVMLREYFKQMKPAKDGYLFAGQYKGEPYSTRSLQLVLAAAKKKAGILKPGSIHTLRHSFATHLLDKGTDVTMIQKLLGHNDIKTTLRYLHVTNRDMLQVMSPLDDLKLD